MPIRPPRRWSPRRAAKRLPIRRTASEPSARDTCSRRSIARRLGDESIPTLRASSATTCWPSSQRTRTTTVPRRTSSRVLSAAAERSAGCSSACWPWCASSTPGALRAPTRRRTEPERAGIQAAFSTGTAGSVEAAASKGWGTKYPEWDVHRRRYRPDWCTVQEVEVRPADGTSGWMPNGFDLRRPLARLGLGLDRHHRQPQGDDIDIDAAIEARVETDGRIGARRDLLRRQPSPPARSRRARSSRHLGLRCRTGCHRPDGARATAGGGSRAHHRSSRDRRSCGALRLPVTGAIRRAAAAGEALRRRSRHRS